MELAWQIKPFDFLRLRELYAILQLRQSVFIVEQNCPFPDLDSKDFKCFHLIGNDAIGELAAYARIIPAGIMYPETSIGRVVTASWARRVGAGKELMKRAIEFIQVQYGQVPIRIGAQLYLKSFYEDFGFKPDGDVYLEDGIEHVEMLKPA